MEENDKIIAIAILSMLALIALIGFILYKIAIHRSIIPNINMAAPSSVPVKNNNFKLVDPNTIIEIKKNKGQEIFKGTDLGKAIINELMNQKNHPTRGGIEFLKKEIALVL